MRKLSTILLASTFFTQSLHAHEIFSVRADIARQEGINVDTIVKHTKQGGQRESEYLNRIMYGLTQYLSLELRLPIFFEKKVSEVNPTTGLYSYFKASGLGKVELLSKLRIYHDYAFQKRNQIVLVSGLLFPTSRTALTSIEKKPIIGNRSMDFIVGTAGAFETTKFYHFAALVYRMNTSARRIKEGDQFLYSYAFGYRPDKPDVNKVDWVFLVDVDGRWQDKDKVNGERLSNTGHKTIFAGPSFFRSRGNLILKGSVQIPVIQHLNSLQEKFDYRAMLGAFLQF